MKILEMKLLGLSKYPYSTEFFSKEIKSYVKRKKETLLKLGIVRYTYNTITLGD